VGYEVAEDTQALGVERGRVGSAAERFWCNVGLCEAKEVLTGGAEEGAVTAISKSFSKGEDQPGVVGGRIGVVQLLDESVSFLLETEQAGLLEQVGAFCWGHFSYDCLAGPYCRLVVWVR
jgi:hypothetical protein